MSKGIIIGSYHQAINPNCQFNVICYRGFYNKKHYYDVQILDNEDIFPLTQNQILCGNFKIPSKKSIQEIYEGVKE